MWEDSLLELEYTPTKARKYALGCAAKIRTMPLKEAFKALNELNDEVMVAGLKNARININSLYKRLNQ